MTLGEQWAYKPADTYKSTKTIVHTLLSVTATGGSLLLDVGPMPTGELPPTALERLEEVGDWMVVNGEAIHDTVPQQPYAINVAGGTSTSTSTSGTSISTSTSTSTSTSKPFEWRLTRKSSAVYAILLLENQSLPLPSTNQTLELPFVVDVPGGVCGTWPQAPLRGVSLLGTAPATVDFTQGSDGLKLRVGTGVKLAAPFAAVFKLDYSTAGS
jgi:hypothetical protein